MDGLAQDREGALARAGHSLRRDDQPAASHTYADDLLANTKTLYDKTRTATFTADQIANGARSLLDEVAKNKVTGEEEYWSRTDLWDFQGNVDGARVGFDGLRPILAVRNPDLEKRIAARFADLQEILDRTKRGSAYKPYDELSQPQVKQLADAVNALDEPVSQLAAAVV